MILASGCHALLFTTLHCPIPLAASAFKLGQSASCLSISESYPFAFCAIQDRQRRVAGQFDLVLPRLSVFVLLFLGNQGIFLMVSTFSQSRGYRWLPLHQSSDWTRAMMTSRPIRQVWLRYLAISLRWSLTVIDHLFAGAPSSPITASVSSKTSWTELEISVVFQPQEAFCSSGHHFIGCTNFNSYRSPRKDCFYRLRTMRIAQYQDKRRKKFDKGIIKPAFSQWRWVSSIGNDHDFVGFLVAITLTSKIVHTVTISRCNQPPE